MQRFCLAVTLSGLILLFTAVTLALITPELLRAQTVGVCLRIIVPAGDTYQHEH